MPAGVAVPTVVPPLVQVVGAELEGPKTEKVMVEVSLVPEEAPKVGGPARRALMAVPAVPVDGDVVTLKVGEATATVVLGMLTLLHRLAAALLLAFDGDDAYHQ